MYFLPLALIIIAMFGFAAMTDINHSNNETKLKLQSQKCGCNAEKIKIEDKENDKAD